MIMEADTKSAVRPRLKIQARQWCRSSSKAISLETGESVVQRLVGRHLVMQVESQDCLLEEFSHGWCGQYLFSSGFQLIG